jgi:hypothetical protein
MDRATNRFTRARESKYEKQTFTFAQRKIRPKKIRQKRVITRQRNVRSSSIAPRTSAASSAIIFRLLYPDAGADKNMRDRLRAVLVLDVFRQNQDRRAIRKPSLLLSLPPGRKSSGQWSNLASRGRSQGKSHSNLMSPKSKLTRPIKEPQGFA